MKKISVVLGLWMFAVVCGAQGVMKLDTNNITLGDQVTLSMKGMKEYPTLEQLNQNDVVALREWYDTATNTMFATLTSFEEGNHVIKFSDDDSLVLVVNDVADVDTTKNDIKDISGIIKMPYTFWEIFRWILLAIAVAALGAGIWWVSKRLKAHKPIIELPKAPPVPADVKALDALEKLRLKQMWQQGKIKEYHTELTDIVRMYLEEDWGIASTDMTSDQTLDAFESTRARTEENEAMLRRILRTADMVKFAKSEPLPFEHDRSLSDANGFVKELAAEKKKEQQTINNSKS